MLKAGGLKTLHQQFSHVTVSTYLKCCFVPRLWLQNKTNS